MKVGPDGTSPMRLKSLMVAVAVVALGLGFLINSARTYQKLEADETIFKSWMVEVEKVEPTLKRAGNSFSFSSNFFELSRRCNLTWQTPTRKTISVQAVFREGPFTSVRQVTFDSHGRSVTWPFEDLVKGRKFNPRAEFPEAFR